MNQEIEPSGKAVGGKARWEGMSAAQKKAASQKALAAKAVKNKLPKATHTGTLELGSIKIPCAVLDDGRRVFSESGVTEALLGTRSGASKKLKKQAEETGSHLPVFLAPGQLKPFITGDLLTGPLQSVLYVSNGKEAIGFDANVLPAACEIWLNARQAGALQKQQLDKAQKAEILMRGLAKVGVIALVDEATGYQRDRAKDDLARILEAFVAKELQPWVKTFPAEYYENLFRLYGLKYPPQDNPNFKPSFFGHVTNNVIYSRLAPELLPELKKAANRQEKKVRLHQMLTNDIGHPKLKEHLAAIVSLQRISKNPDQFMQFVDTAFPKFGDTKALDFEGDHV